MIVLVQLAATEFINSMKLSNSNIVEKRIVFESHKSNQYVIMQQLIYALLHRYGCTSM